MNYKNTILAVLGTILCGLTGTMLWKIDLHDLDNWSVKTLSTLAMFGLGAYYAACYGPSAISLISQLNETNNRTPEVVQPFQPPVVDPGGDAKLPKPRMHVMVQRDDTFSLMQLLLAACHENGDYATVNDVIALQSSYYQRRAQSKEQIPLQENIADAKTKPAVSRSY